MLWRMLKVLLFILGGIFSVKMLFRLPKDISELLELWRDYKERNNPEVLQLETSDNPVLAKVSIERKERLFKTTLFTQIFLWTLTFIYIVWFLIIVLGFVIVFLLLSFS